MTLEQSPDSFRRGEPPRVRTPRVRLKPKAHRSGYVDGAWWPRSDDLATELPDLIAVLSLQLRAIDRVTYDLSEWAAAPAELATGGRAVRLDGYHRQPPDTLEVLDSNDNKIVLLVVPFHTDPDHAHAIVMAAAAADNVSSVDTLLMISVEDRESRTERTATQDRWESQGEPNHSTSRDRPWPMRQVFPALSRPDSAAPTGYKLGPQDYDD
jgi:Family of unknown function (DUF5994)